jgi:hypothetical protein
MMTDEPNAADDVVEEVREARRQLWARFENDPAKLVAYLQEYHQQLLCEGWEEAPPRDSQDKSAA